MNRLVAALLIAVGFLATAGTACIAERRVALVIGNSAYQTVEKLKNPGNDASRLADTLKTIGFDKVTLKLDQTHSQMLQMLNRFSREAAGADIALVYFAGHGIEVGGTNYIIPTDARLGHVDDVEFQAIELSKLMRSLGRAGKLKLVILDACRNNPFRQTMERTGSKRSVGRGFAPMSVRNSDTLIAYAARDGTVADDGDGENSPYTSALIKQLAIPGVEIRLMFGKVRDDVLAATGRRQEPFTYGSLGGQAIYLSSLPRPAPVPDVPARPKPENPLNADALFWSSVKDSKTAEPYKAYLKQFPDGTFASLAKLRIEALENKNAIPEPKEPDPTAPASVAPVEAPAEDDGCNEKSAAPSKVTPDLDIGQLRSMAEYFETEEVIPCLAARFHRAAAARGDAESTVALAHLLDRGHGVKQDSRRAANTVFDSLRARDDKARELILNDHLENAFKQWSKPFRLELQRLLKQAGHYTSTIDGKFGSGTKRAILKLARIPKNRIDPFNGKLIPLGKNCPKNVWDAVADVFPEAYTPESPPPRGFVTNKMHPCGRVISCSGGPMFSKVPGGCNWRSGFLRVE